MISPDDDLKEWLEVRYELYGAEGDEDAASLLDWMKERGWYFERIPEDK